jgi:hypothetical protein
MQERRTAVAGTKRRSFADLSREALEKHVSEARTPEAHWGGKPNLGWVRYRGPDGRYVFIALRRHLNWVTGEIGISRTAVELEGLDLKAAPEPGTAYRVRLGEMLHDEDKWWPAGDNEKELVEILDWLVLQMRVKVEKFFRGK